MAHSPEDIQRAHEQAGTIKGAARLLGCCPKTVRKHVRSYRVPDLPSKHLSAAEVIEYRTKQFKQLRAAKMARERVVIDMDDDRPIAILHVGDPHVDDQGTDLETLYHHTDIIRKTPGMYGACIGDVTNNWVGNLKRLYAEQSTSEADGWLIAQDFLARCDWLYMVKGNHDCWSGAGDPLDWYLRDNHGITQEHRCRLRLAFPNRRDIDLFAAHNFKGNSQWNPAHGVGKTAQMGITDHILVNGHTHVSAYQTVKSRDPMLGIDGGRISHCLQIASYKTYDKYAEQLGLADHSFGPCCVTVINPRATREVNLVQVIWDPEEAAWYLAALRRRYK